MTRTCWLLAVVVLLVAIALPAYANPSDPKATVADVFAFRSYRPGTEDRVTLIMTIDPMLDPGSDPERGLFDPDVRYDFRIDNNNDAIEDIVFRFDFTSRNRLPDFPLGYGGVADGADAPANSPPPVAPGTEIVPPRITSFTSKGLGLRQSYSVVRIRSGVSTSLTGSTRRFVVPENPGPRTMDYPALFTAAIHTFGNGVRVFAGRVDDPAFADFSGLYDTFNFAKSPPILSAAEDAALVNLASDTRSGFSVNAIAIEIPISMLTRTGAIEPASSPAATIGVWATTSRPRLTERNSPDPPISSGSFRQVDRRGLPLMADLVIPTGAREAYRLQRPQDDGGTAPILAIAPFVLDPEVARILNALFGGAMAIPNPPRNDLLPLVTYAPPIAAPGTPAGPVADMLRLNTGVNPTAAANINRLGLLGGDPAGFPNGRRLDDDVLDIMLRLVAGGILAGAPFSTSPINTRLGDGVNVNDTPSLTTFPYLGLAPNGRNRRHVDPGEPQCTPIFGGGAACLP